MAEVNQLRCCGARELVIGGSVPKNVIATLCRSEAAGGGNARLALHTCQVLFTQNVASEQGYGYKLSAYIRKNELGTVVVSDTAANPNTGNPITAFIWTINPAGLRRWWDKNRPKGGR